MDCTKKSDILQRNNRTDFYEIFEHLVHHQLIGMVGMDKITDKLKKLREKSGLSVREVARLIDVPTSTYQAKEDPNKIKRDVLPFDFIESLAPVFCSRGVSPKELYALAGLTEDKIETIFGVSLNDHNKLTLNNGLKATVKHIGPEQFTPLQLGYVCKIDDMYKHCVLDAIGEQQVIYEITSLGEKSDPMSFYPEETANTGRVQRKDGTESSCRIEGVVLRLEP
jgi:DNA-binding XRE family transcriptional regulator